MQVDRRRDGSRAVQRNGNIAAVFRQQFQNDISAKGKTDQSNGRAGTATDHILDYDFQIIAAADVGVTAASIHAGTKTAHVDAHAANVLMVQLGGNTLHVSRLVTAAQSMHHHDNPVTRLPLVRAIVVYNKMVPMIDFDHAVIRIFRFPIGGQIICKDGLQMAVEIERVNLEISMVVGHKVNRIEARQGKQNAE